MRYRVLPYRQGSKGAKALAVALGGRVLKLQGSTFVPKPDDMVINWGYAQATSTVSPNLLAYGEELPLNLYKNGPGHVRFASNKLEFFRLMSGMELTPAFWENKEDIPDDAFPIVCRTILAGHSGAGIVIAYNRDELVDAPLYVRYVKKKDEYRVHVGKKGNDIVIIAVQRKARRRDIPNSQVNWQVRNHSNGFVFVRQGVNPPEAVTKAARDALGASGLDFGAVDVIWNSEQEKAYVLEINTAPGLEGQTVADYANFFRGLGG